MLDHKRPTPHPEQLLHPHTRAPGPRMGGVKKTLFWGRKTKKSYIHGKICVRHHGIVFIRCLCFPIPENVFLPQNYGP